jgi:protein-disulfide isomerase
MDEPLTSPTSPASPTSPDTLPVTQPDSLVISRSRLTLAIIPVAFLAGLLAGYLYWGRGPGASAAIAQAVSATATAQQAEVAAQEQQVTRYDVPVDDDPALGPEDAAITIIEFSDYECPYCQSWHTQTFARLLETFPDQIRFVYRDFPLSSIHPNAAPAAEAANCAGEQGKYWEFNELLFSGQNDLSPQTYTQYAGDLGLDGAAFEECVTSGRYQAEVQADLDWAANLGVRSTPTFFINGIPLIGAQPYEVFKQVIEKELAGEIPK